MHLTKCVKLDTLYVVTGRKIRAVVFDKVDSHGMRGSSLVKPWTLEDAES